MLGMDDLLIVPRCDASTVLILWPGVGKRAKFTRVSSWRSTDMDWGVRFRARALSLVL
jgi:hypothetical protein